MTVRPVTLSKPMCFLLGELTIFVVVDVLPRFLVPKMARRWL